MVGKMKIKDVEQIDNSNKVDIERIRRYHLKAMEQKTLYPRAALMEARIAAG